MGSGDKPAPTNFAQSAYSEANSASMSDADSSVSQSASIERPASVAAATPVLPKKGMSALSKIFITLSFVVALAAGGAAGWVWYSTQQSAVQQQLAQQEIDRTLQQQRNQIAELTTLLNQINSKDAQQAEQLQRMRKSDEQVLARVASFETQVTELTGAHRIDWMLKEAEHFVVVAEQRLSLLSDVDGALALLTEADDLVRDMREPATRKLRAALTQDLIALRAAATSAVDTEGNFAVIEALIGRVAGLEKAMVTYVAEPDTKSTSDVIEASDSVAMGPWDRFIGKLSGFAQSLYRVETIGDAEIKPFLRADQQEYLRQNIYVLLEQAQLTLLRTDYVGYKLSLEQARKRISEHLNVAVPETQAVVAELDRLIAKDMVANVPSIEQSVRALQVFREYWQQEKVDRELQRSQLDTESSSTNSQQ
mgnify:CR=1 FL=1